MSRLERILQPALVIEETQELLEDIIVPDVPIQVVDVTDQLPTNIDAFIEQTFSPEDDFRYAKQEWEAAYDFNKLETVIHRFGYTAEYPQIEDDFLYLKGVRQAAIVYASAWKLYSKKHTAPKELKVLVKQIGTLKDTLNHPQLRPAVAHKAFKSLCNYDDMVTSSSKRNIESAQRFKPAKFDNFLEFYKNIVYSVQTLVNKSPLTLDEYHTVRKQFRFINKYFLILAERTSLVQAFEMYRLLHAISGTMGKVQDVFIDLELQGKVDKHTQLTVIQPDHLQMIIQFLSIHIHESEL